MSDASDIEAQIGRPLRAPSEVAARCHLGLPVVVEVPPILDDGTPFPTRFWLSCPLAGTRIGRLEGSGGVKRMEAKAAADPGFGAELDAAHSRHSTERDALLAPDANPRPSGGIGGTTRGVKCLHAHYADHVSIRERSDASSPVGELVAAWVEPLDCEVPCVVDGAVNPDWKPRP